MNRPSIAALVAALSLLVSTAAWASHKAPLPRDVVTPADFPARVESIRQDMAPGGRYLVNDQQRTQVEQDLDGMQKLLAGHARVDELTPQQQIDLFNAQERVNAVLTQRDGDEKICRVEAVTGSAIATRVCDTRRQLEARQADGATAMKEIQRNADAPQARPPGG